MRLKQPIKKETEKRREKKLLSSKLAQPLNVSQMHELGVVRTHYHMFQRANTQGREGFLGQADRRTPGPKKKSKDVSL